MSKNITVKKDYHLCTNEHLKVGIAKDNHDVDENCFESQSVLIDESSENIGKKASDNFTFPCESLKKSFDSSQHKKIGECTLLLELHNESCNTNLDPEHAISQSGVLNDSPKYNYDLFQNNIYNCMDILHQQSCMTNLDPYTKTDICSEEKSSSYSNTKTEIFNGDEYCQTKDVHTSEMFNNRDGSFCFNTENEFSDLSYELSQPVCSFKKTEKHVFRPKKRHNPFQLEDSDNFWDS